MELQSSESQSRRYSDSRALAKPLAYPVLPDSAIDDNSAIDDKLGETGANCKPENLWRTALVARGSHATRCLAPNTPIRRDARAEAGSRWVYESRKIELATACGARRDAHGRARISAETAGTPGFPSLPRTGMPAFRGTRKTRPRPCPALECRPRSDRSPRLGYGSETG